MKMASHTLHYKSLGEGTPLIILHGLFGSGDNWNLIARDLSEQYRVILPDLRNHGRSFHSAHQSIDLMAGDVIHLLQELGLERAWIIGHSMGGKVAMNLALNQPAYTKGLICLDMAPKAYPRGHDEIFRVLMQTDVSNTSSRAPIEAQMSETIHSPAIVQFLMKSLARNSSGTPGFHWRFNIPVLYDNYADIINPLSILETYSGPTLFIRGGQSKYILDEDMTQILSLFPDAQLVTIPEAGHWLHADQPEAVIAAIRTFIG